MKFWSKEKSAVEAMVEAKGENIWIKATVETLDFFSQFNAALVTAVYRTNVSISKFQMIVLRILLFYYSSVAHRQH